MEISNPESLISEAEAGYLWRGLSVGKALWQPFQEYSAHTTEKFPQTAASLMRSHS